MFIKNYFFQLIKFKYFYFKGLPGKQGIPGQSCSNCREIFNSLLLEQNFVNNKKQQEKSVSYYNPFSVKISNNKSIENKLYSPVLNETFN